MGSTGFAVKPQLGRVRAYQPYANALCLRSKVQTTCACAQGQTRLESLMGTFLYIVCYVGSFYVEAELSAHSNVSAAEKAGLNRGICATCGPTGNCSLLHGELEF